jgi:hypothetical protein
MARTRKPTIRKGPAERYAPAGESIYEFSDGKSGGLISIRRHPLSGELTLQVYNADADVVVQVPAANRPAGEPDPEPEPAAHVFGEFDGPPPAGARTFTRDAE